MSFFKKLFQSSKSKETKATALDTIELPIDETFVQNFIAKNGKFLYCTSLDEVVLNLANIFEENNWDHIVCNDIDLLKLVKTLNIKTTEGFNNSLPVFLGCEYLIAENGSILFSSNQLKDYKISEFSDDFIVYATTSQLVKNNDESLTGIKTKYQGNIPSNISAIKSFDPSKKDLDFMTYGNNNSKNLYLLLFEDL